MQALLKRAPRKDNKVEFLRRVKFGMSKKRFKVLLSDFDEYNKELECFTKSEQLEPHRASSRSVFSSPLPQIRSYTKSIYSVLYVRMSCHASHRARLRPENRIATSGKVRFKLRRPTESEQDPAVCSTYLCMPLMHRMQRAKSHGFGKMPRPKSWTPSIAICYIPCCTNSSRHLNCQGCLRCLKV